jgi:hypothetical protein
MNVGEIWINLGNNSLILSKGKWAGRFELSFHIIIWLAVFVIPTFWIINAKGLDWVDVSVVLGFAAYLGILVIFLIYNLRRTKLKYKTFIIQKVNSNLVINDESICSMTELENIIIQKMTDGDGASYYNVGVRIQQGRFFPLCLEQGKDDATSLASIIANYLDKEVRSESGKMIFP